MEGSRSEESSILVLVLAVLVDAAKEWLGQRARERLRKYGERRSTLQSGHAQPRGF